MSTEQPTPDLHEQIQADFSDYRDGSLSRARRTEIDGHRAGCDLCNSAFDEFRRTMDALSGLHRMSAPQDFDKGVEKTIRERSAGRFFGRRAFGDRIPFELLAVLALIFGLFLFVMIRSSDTGSLRYDKAPDAPHIEPGAKEALPQP